MLLVGMYNYIFVKIYKLYSLRMNFNGKCVFWMIIGDNFGFIDYNKYITSEKC